MALLTKEQRATRFKYLGLGEYNKANLLKFQKMAFPNKPGQQDSKYGENSDRALRHFYNVKRYTKDFKPQEFKCTCGKCTGYPTYMKKVELQHLQTIRDHYGKPMIITSALRCPYENKRVGGISNSGHLKGYAADFYMVGVTDTIKNRKSSLAWIKKLPNHEFTYGASIKDSNGLYRSAKSMGNAMHTETHKPKVTAKKTTTKTVTNVATKPAATTKSTFSFNKGKKNQYLTDAELKKLLNTFKKQVEWSKNSSYKWVNPPTVENSKTRSTCIALYACAMQRLGLFKKGGYFYLHPTKKRISGNRRNYVRKHHELFKLLYPKKSVIAMIKSGEIQIGDYVGYYGKGYHSMAYLGYKVVNKKIVPLFATLGHRRGYNVTYPSYAKRKVGMIVRPKKISK